MTGDITTSKFIWSRNLIMDQKFQEWLMVLRNCSDMIDIRPRVSDYTTVAEEWPDLHWVLW